MKSNLASEKLRYSNKQIFRRANQLAWLAVVIFGIVGLPKKVRAHGELLIRIGAVTQKIAVATNHAPLYLQRGELYREDQNWTAAEADYARATQLEPDLTATVDFCRAKLLDDSGQLVAARAMFDQVISHSPKNGEAFIGRARVARKLDEPKPAIADFQRGLELLRHPKPEYFLELAQELMVENQINDALHSLDAGIKHFGPIASLQLYALELELAQKNYDRALVRLDTLLQRAERKENWLARRGDILLTAGRFADAKKSFQASLAAIKILPMVLQKAVPMQNLQSHIQTELDKIAAPSLSQNSK